MMIDDGRGSGLLRELDEEECWALVGQRGVARVAYNDSRGPMCLPVAFAIDGRTVLVRVSPYAELAQHVPGAPAAIEVDELDHERRTGWSVVMRGVVQAVAIDDLPAPESRPIPWPDGQRTLHLRLTPSTVTGRRLQERDVARVEGEGGERTTTVDVASRDPS
jgi:uncharacterized protein